MIRILKSAIFKLFKDWTFRITLIIGAALAVVMNLLYLGIDIVSADGGAIVHNMGNGQSLLLSSFSPVQNFCITVPINLVVFTVGEFTYGTIRNKVIAGYKKSQIYLSLALIGLLFTISLVAIYVGISTAIGSIIGGFDANGMVSTMGQISPTFILRYIAVCFAAYIFIGSLAIFVATSVRTIGGGLPIIIISTIFLYMFGMIHSLATANIDMATGVGEIKNNAFMFIDPLYIVGMLSGSSAMLGGGVASIDNFQFVSSIASSIGWAVVFTVLGTILFSKRDIK